MPPTCISLFCFVCMKHTHYISTGFFSLDQVLGLFLFLNPLPFHPRRLPPSETIPSSPHLGIRTSLPSSLSMYLALLPKRGIWSTARHLVVRLNHHHSHWPSKALNAYNVHDIIFCEDSFSQSILAIKAFSKFSVNEILPRIFVIFYFLPSIDPTFSTVWNAPLHVVLRA